MLFTRITKLFTQSTQRRVRRLLAQAHTDPRIARVKQPAETQRDLGIDLIIELKDGQQCNLQFQPTYAIARASAHFTHANLAIIVANDSMPDGLLIKKIRESIDFLSH